MGSSDADHHGGAAMRKIVIVEVENYGWLAMGIVNGTEEYRGEFRDNPMIALRFALDWYNGSQS
jgi:hypothetical protein